MNNTCIDCIGGKAHQFTELDGRTYTTWCGANTADGPPLIDAARYQVVKCAICGIESVRWI